MVYQALLAYPTKHRLCDLARLWQAYRHATPGAQVTLWLLLLLIFSRGQAWRQGRRDCVLLLGLLGTAILGAWTSSMNPAGNLGLLGLQLTVMARLAWRVAPMPWPAPPTRYWRWGLLALTRAWLPVLLLVAAYTGWERRQFIWSWNSANQNNSYRLQTPAFAGWRCDPALGAGTDEAVQAIQRLVPARDSLLILPYGTWIYGLLGRDSYTPAPFIFHEGELPFPGEKAAAFRQQLLTDPPAWLLLHDHQTVWFSTASGILTWLDLRDWLQQSYQPVWHFGRWHLLRHPQRASDGLRLPQPAGPPAGDAGPPIPAGKPPDLTARVWMVPGIDLKMVPVLPGALARPGQAAGPAPPPTQPYWIAVYELTQRQYGLLMGDNPSHWRDPWGPVESISWRAAMGVALRLTRREQAAGRLPAGYAYRLPTAAEWAYAAGGGRAGEHRGDSGSDDLDALAWHAGNSQDRPQWPGKKLPNALGLYDLSGNVAEWCLEPLAGAGQAPPLVASGPAPGAMRLVLGGSFGDAPEAWRGGPPARSLAPLASHAQVGVRLVLAPKVPTP